LLSTLIGSLVSEARLLRNLAITEQECGGQHQQSLLYLNETQRIEPSIFFPYMYNPSYKKTVGKQLSLKHAFCEAAACGLVCRENMRGSALGVGGGVFVCNQLHVDCFPAGRQFIFSLLLAIIVLFLFWGEIFFFSFRQKLFFFRFFWVIE
jgi:hypothetical protein